MNKLFLFLFLIVSSTASAIIIRQDVDDSKYLVPASEFPALAEMPGEAHGVLIAPHWVVTAAHTTLGHPEEIIINGLPRKVERLIVHPGYKKLPEELIAQAIKSGDASTAMAFQASNDDIALIKLSAPVTDVMPATLYRRDNELGKTVKFIGKGATGNGTVGQTGPNRTVLRRAYSKIKRTDGHWLVSQFNSGLAAHALEGMSGSGDSGGPVLIKVKGHWQLAGLAAWKYVDGNAATFRMGVYGQTTYNVRISSYARWIESVMSSDATPHAAGG